MKDIDELNQLAKALLQKVAAVRGTLGKKGEASAAALETARDLLGGLCKDLTGLEKVLARPEGPLQDLVRLVDESSLLSNAANAAERFLDSHAKALRRIGVPDNAAESLITTLEDEIRHGVIRLNEAATLSSDDANGMLVQLRALRDLICELHADAVLFAEVWNPELAAACLDGVTGVCKIVIDVTTAVGAPHVTMFAVLVAVQSTLSGYRALRRSVEKVKAGVAAAKEAIKAKLRRETLKGTAPQVKLQRRPKDG